MTKFTLQIRIQKPHTIHQSFGCRVVDRAIRETINNPYVTVITSMFGIRLTGFEVGSNPIATAKVTPELGDFICQYDEHDDFVPRSFSLEFEGEEDKIKKYLAHLVG